MLVTNNSVIGVLVFGRHARAAFAAAILRAECGERRALDIAAMGDGDDHLFAFHQVFVVDAVPARGDFAQARRGEFAVDGFQLFAHHRIQLYAVAQNRQIFVDLDRQLLQFIANFIAAKRGQAVQAQIKDRADLNFGQLIGVAGRSRSRSPRPI